MKFAVPAVAALVVLAAFTFIRADDKPAAAADSKAPKNAKITAPWNKLSSLTDEQKEKIKTIHVKFLEEQKALKEKETTDITALLTDDQKTELKSITEKDSAG